MHRKETRFSIAVETAETGPLVFGTLHTTTAVSIVDCIIDQFPADRQSQIRVMLSESLRGVIAQTFSNNIREGKTYQIPTAIQTGKKDGMILLNEFLVTLVNNNLIRAVIMATVFKGGVDAIIVGFHYGPIINSGNYMFYVNT